jgi:ribosome-associated toxin RatA of RatAB toxin-antitoxin module
MADTLNSSMILLVLAVLQPLAAAAAPGDWTADPAVQRRLAAGQVVVAAASVVDPEHPRGHVSAAVRINSSPEAIWSVMTDCRQAPLFVPGLKSCRRVDGASDGSWEDIEHEVRYSWWLPTVRYVFRAQYDRPHRIDTRRISGDLKEEDGTWRLTPAADAAATVVEYDVYVDPGFWIPQALITRSLRKDLPAALAGLRDRVESTQVAAQQLPDPAHR